MPNNIDDIKKGPPSVAEAPDAKQQLEWLKDYINMRKDLDDSVLKNPTNLLIILKNIHRGIIFTFMTAIIKDQNRDQNKDLKSKNKNQPSDELHDRASLNPASNNSKVQQANTRIKALFASNSTASNFLNRINSILNASNLEDPDNLKPDINAQLDKIEKHTNIVDTDEYIIREMTWQNGLIGLFDAFTAPVRFNDRPSSSNADAKKSHKKG